MKRYIINISLLATVMVMVAACSFLDEDPKTFLSPKNYFKSEAQIVAAVNGIYTFVDDIFDGDIEVGTQTYLFGDYLAGYGSRLRGAGTTDIGQLINLTVAENSGYLQKIWQTAYVAIENCNSVIEGLEPIVKEMNDGEPETIISLTKGTKLLGEVYFLRGYNYFNLVRTFGKIPLKLSSTKSLGNVAVPLSSQEDIYEQIEKDLVRADDLMTKDNEGNLLSGAQWTSIDGRVGAGAVKSLLAKVYMTMADYPLQKGVAYYTKAYDMAKEVYSSGKFSLFDNYADMRDPSKENTGEFIWMVQRERDQAGSPAHNNLLPYPQPAKDISKNPSAGGVLAPTKPFYDSYTAGDLRTAEKGYYYTEHEALDGSGIISLGRPYIYKFWDSSAANSGKSGANYCLIRYADILLIMAEAKAQADGGTTSDIDAIKGYYQVRKRANQGEPQPGQITSDEVLKERFWELCFENQTWYDMLRTRKAFNTTTKQIINMIGYQAPGHPEGRAFKESDLESPYPLREKRLNPNLVKE